MTHQTRTNRNIAIIGAGAAGLAAASVLQRTQSVTLFEQHSVVGGLWCTHDNFKHTALYPSLRSNLPAGLMAFLDFPFQRQLIPEHEGDYPGPAAVAAYLQAYADHHQLIPKIQFNAEVTRVSPINDTQWLIEFADRPAQIFDAVVVCNGHYTQPNRPLIKGSTESGLNILHAKDYINPDPFRDQRVLVWGSKASGMDLVREISTTAKQVYWCGHDPGMEALVHDKSNVSIHSDPTKIDQDTIELADGERLTDVDQVLFCTGYQYQFPFLDKAFITSRRQSRSRSSSAHPAGQTANTGLHRPALFGDPLPVVSDSEPMAERRLYRPAPIARRAAIDRAQRRGSCTASCQTR